MFDSVSILATIVNFFILLFILTKLLYKPVRSFLDERSQSIEQEIESATKQNQEAAELRKRLEAELNQSKQKAKQYLDQAIKRSEEIQDEMIKNAKQEAELIQNRTREQLMLERKHYEETLKKNIVELSVVIASRIIKESLDEQKHQQLIDQALTSLDEKNLGEWQ